MMLLVFTIGSAMEESPDSSANPPSQHPIPAENPSKTNFQQQWQDRLEALVAEDEGKLDGRLTLHSRERYPEVDPEYKLYGYNDDPSSSLEYAEETVVVEEHQVDENGKSVMAAGEDGVEKPVVVEKEKLVEVLKVKMEKSTAAQCKYLHDILEADLGDDVVGLANVNGPTLELLVKYMEHHATNGLPTEPIDTPLVRPEPIGTGQEVKGCKGVSDWDAKFMDDLNDDQVFQLLLAANYLHHEALLELCMAKVASKIKGQTVQQIYKNFGIPDTEEGKITEAEDAYIKLDNMKWMEPEVYNTKAKEIGSEILNKANSIEKIEAWFRVRMGEDDETYRLSLGEQDKLVEIVLEAIKNINLGATEEEASEGRKTFDSEGRKTPKTVKDVIDAGQNLDDLPEPEKDKLKTELGAIIISREEVPRLLRRVVKEDEQRKARDQAHADAHAVQ